MLPMQLADYLTVLQGYRYTLSWHNHMANQLLVRSDLAFVGPTPSSWKGEKRVDWRVPEWPTLSLVGTKIQVSLASWPEKGKSASQTSGRMPEVARTAICEE